MKRIRRYFDLMFKPHRAMKGMAPDWWDVGIILGLVILLNIWITLSQTSWAEETIRWLEIIGGNVVGWILVWIILSVILYSLSHYLKGFGNFWKFQQYMGYAAVPFLLTNTISLLLMLIIFIIDRENGLAAWNVVNQVLAVVGMAWAWPGCLSFAAVRVVLFLPQRRTIYLFIGLWIFLIIGWLLPIVVPLFL